MIALFFIISTNDLAVCFFFILTDLQSFSEILTPFIRETSRTYLQEIKTATWSDLIKSRLNENTG